MKNLFIFLFIISSIFGCKPNNTLTSNLNQEASNNSKSDPCTINCKDDDKSSPWNFYANFEDNSWKAKLTPNDKGRGWGPYKIIEENGNKFLSITVKSGWNRARGSRGQPTERSELQTSKRKTYGKEVWYGFKIKKPEETELIFDRLLINQFKQMARNGKVSPLIKIFQRVPDKSLVSMHICGMIGGPGYRIMGPNLLGSEKYSHEVNFYCGDKLLEGNYTFQNKDIFDQLFSADWKNVVFGTYVINNEQGFIKIYINKKLVFDYKGPTYGWSNIVGSYVRIGPYRNGKRYGKHPPQTFYYDDFVIGSKDDVTKVLWK